jgi:Domain of unknown function (DUF4386)
MATSSVDESQRKAARLAGAVYLLSFATVVSVNFGIFFRLLVGSPTQIAGNVLAHQTLFRIGLVGQLLYCVGVLVVSVALYVVLRPVDHVMALLAALGRIVHGITWLLVSLNLFTALRLLIKPDYVGSLPAEQLAVLARLHLTGFDQYYVGLLFWSLGSTVAAYLWFRARYVPRALAAFGIAASMWGALCCLALFVFPDFPKLVGLSWFDVPMVLFEIALSFLLVSRGVRVPEHSADD